MQAALTSVFDAQNVSLVPTYYHNDYIQHSPEIEDGQAGITKAIKQMQEAGLKPSREIARIVAENDLVAVHSRVKIGGHSAIVADIFRLEEGKIIEHWDTTQPETPAEKSANGNSMLDGGGNAALKVSTAALERNKSNVKAFIEQGFAGDKKLLASLFGDEYIQHNPMVPNGKEVILGFLEKGGFPATIHQIVAQGDLTFALVEYPAFNNAAIDIFRHDAQGKIVEHWDIVQKIPETLAHKNGMF
ncbi:nuclear transport factor 2 family protein [Polycladidibacter hongkongensis]|uniref:nuclear transport factor 2 family protein n=1 Tax=Polycladidibacter hongkongensis TaxID=1647556 RepID=UPI001AD8FBFC|nr:nuclear transport factor 2 family protein [Pseudovibrio hongkongensis]